MAKDVYYNQKRKDEFMNSIPNNRILLAKRIFLASIAIEKNKKKDLCDFDRDELLEFYSYLDVATPSILRDVHSLVKDYLTFNKVYNEDINNINIKILRSKVNKIAVRTKIISREELIERLKESEKDRTFNPSDAFILLAFFEGMWNKDYTDIQNLTIDDFVRENDQYYVHLSSGRTIIASDELYQYAKDSSLLESRRINYKSVKIRAAKITSENPRAIIKYNKISPAESEEIKIRRKKKTIYYYMQHELKLCNLPKIFINPYTLRLSGIIDRIKKDCERENYEYDWYMEHKVMDLAEQFGINNMPIYKTTIKDYLYI